MERDAEMSRKPVLLRAKEVTGGFAAAVSQFPLNRHVLIRKMEE